MSMKEGDPIVWLHEPRGSYGYIYPVNGVITKLCRTKVKIKVQRKDGHYKEVAVSLNKLKQRQ